MAPGAGTIPIFAVVKVVPSNAEVPPLNCKPVDAVRLTEIVGATKEIPSPAAKPANGSVQVQSFSKYVLLAAAAAVGTIPTFAPPLNCVPCEAADNLP